MIESCGAFSRVAHPGINCLNCCTERIVPKQLSLRVEQHKINVETRSKDNVFVTLRMAVQIKVAENAGEFPKRKTTKKTRKDKEKHEEKEVLVDEDEKPARSFEQTQRDDRVLYNAFYKLHQPVDQILAHMEEYFRFHGMEYTLDEMFAAKNDMTHELQSLLNDKMNPYGYIICNILVIDIDPDKKVKDAMNDIIASEKEKRAQQSRAEAEKITKILSAEAEARTRELAGEGIANARKAIVSGLQESVENFQQAIPDSDPCQILVTVLMTQYLDTIKEAAQNGKNTFIMPSSPQQVSTMEDQFRMAILTGRENKL